MPDEAYTVMGAVAGEMILPLVTVRTPVHLMPATRTLTSDLIVLVSVGSMIIADATNACGEALERFRADMVAHVGQIEARAVARTAIA